jgi:hypothetical protein
MKLFLKILLLYLLALVLSVLSTGFFTRWHEAVGFYRTSAFLLGPMLFIFAGLVIGVFILMLGKIKNKQKFIFNFALTGCLLFCLLMTSFRFYNWYHYRYLANIEANEDFLNNGSTYSKQEHLAFKLLKDKYENPNNIRLTRTSVSRYDTLINKRDSIAYDIEFLYFKKTVKGFFKSKCTVIGDSGSFEYFDRLLNDSEQNAIDSSNNEGLREGLKAILGDSERIALDSATKATIREKIKSKKITLDTLPSFR